LDTRRRPHRRHHARDRERFRRAAGAGDGLLDAGASAQSLSASALVFLLPMSDISSDIVSTVMTLMSEIRRPGAGGPDRAGWIRSDLCAVTSPDSRDHHPGGRRGIEPPPTP